VSGRDLFKFDDREKMKTVCHFTDLGVICKGEQCISYQHLNPTTAKLGKLSV
jgi:hypothetical protein